jgi:hypothetical protein
MFCGKLGEGATDGYEKIQKAFGNYSVSRTQVFQWHKVFVNGRETVEDEPRARRPARLWEQAQTSTVWGLSFVKIDVWQLP